MKSIKALCVLMAVILLLCGCQTTEAAPSTTAPTTVSTEPVPTEPAPIDNEEALRAALEAGGRVNLEGDIQLTQTLGVRGNLLDGGGYTITGMEYVENEVSTENAVMITSGTVQNLNVVGAYRCLGDCPDYPQDQDVRIKNVTADGTLYALSVGRGSGKGSLYVEDCTLRGWTIPNRLKEVRFTNCTFGWNYLGDSGHFMSYVDVELIDCHFEPKTDENGKQTPFNITFNKSRSGITVTLENCYVGDTLITQENLHTLLKVTEYGNRVIVRNTTS